jgi:hypothetical protein
MNLLIDIRLPNEGDRTNHDSMPCECVESPGPVQAGAGSECNTRLASNLDDSLIAAAQADPDGVRA